MLDKTRKALTHVALTLQSCVGESTIVPHCWRQLIEEHGQYDLSHTSERCGGT